MQITKIELKHQAEPLSSTYKWALILTDEKGERYGTAGWVGETFGPAIVITELPNSEQQEATSDANTR